MRTMKHILPLTLASFACLALTACVPQSTHDAVLANVKLLESRTKEAEAKLEEMKAALATRDRELTGITSSPEYEFWKIRNGQQSPRERLSLLTAFAAKHAKTDMVAAANQAVTVTANGIGDAADQLVKQRKYADATALVSGVSDGLPQLREFESQWKDKIQKLADYDARVTAEEQFRERFKAGQIRVDETVALVRGKSPNEVMGKLGRPDSTSQETLGQQFTYWTGAFNAYTGKGEMLVIAFADAPINKVISVKSASSPAYVDEDVRRQVNTYLRGR